VVAIDLPAKEAQLRQLSQQIGGHTQCLDLGEPNAANQLVGSLCSQLGVIDILVHNAGITRDKTLRKMPEPFWDQVLDIDLGKILQINQQLLAQEVFNPRGRIVCVSSIAGIAGNFGQTNYACAKSALAGYVEAAARSSENGMTFNAVAPGFIETEMTAAMPFLSRELGRRVNTLHQGGLPVDVAEAIALFCHPAAQALNGNVLRVCGQSLLGR
jgi:3-oxoacyl-[acyl-carrier protein] reductase